MGQIVIEKIGQAVLALLALTVCPCTDLTFYGISQHLLFNKVFAKPFNMTYEKKYSLWRLVYPKRKLTHIINPF